MSIVGRTYLERGQPVEVTVQWGPGGGPRNVTIRRADGSTVVRPFRGLRRTSPPPRRPRNGHHADCPYPTQDAATCPICAGIRKAPPEPEGQ